MMHGFDSSSFLTFSTKANRGQHHFDYGQSVYRHPEFFLDKRAERGTSYNFPVKYYFCNTYPSSFLSV
jgi:hypothetical protein